MVVGSVTALEWYGRGIIKFGALVVFLVLAMLSASPLVSEANSLQKTGLSSFRTFVALPPQGESPYRGNLKEGQFLVASQRLGDSRFSETVILLLQYSSKGAIGLVINRPTEVRLSSVFEDMQGLEQRTDTVFVGGPVGMNQIFMLLRSGSPPEESRRIFGDVYVSSSRVLLERIIEDEIGQNRFRIYAGYAGWAPGQIDQEILRGDWHILRADAETLFEKSPAEVWPTLIRRTAYQWVKAGLTR
jgi:putative transcriptional regulator